MRRTAVLAALAAGVLAVAGCGGDEGKDSDGSVEAICTSMQSVAEPLEDEFGPALTEAGIAGAQGDQEALAEAMTKLDQVTEQITTAANEAADRADDPEFAQALRDWGTALENLVANVGEGNMPDLAELEAASTAVGRFCGEFESTS